MMDPDLKVMKVADMVLKNAVRTVHHSTTSAGPFSFSKAGQDAVLGQSASLSSGTHLWEGRR
jgi:hypothetical protein